MSDFTYVEAYTSEHTGSNWHFGIKIQIATGRTLSDDADYRIIDHHAEEIFRAIMARSFSLDPERIATRKAERAAITGLFDQPVFVQERPNGYCSDWCCRDRPWFLVTTKRGRIEIGWRKRVIHICWDDGNTIARTAAEIFPNEDVTKSGNMIHAWGYDKAREYIRVLMKEGEQP